MRSIWHTQFWWIWNYFLAKWSFTNWCLDSKDFFSRVLSFCTPFTQWFLFWDPTTHIRTKSGQWRESHHSTRRQTSDTSPRWWLAGNQSPWVANPNFPPTAFWDKAGLVERISVWINLWGKVSGSSGILSVQFWVAVITQNWTQTRRRPVEFAKLKGQDQACSYYSEIMFWRFQSGNFEIWRMFPGTVSVSPQTGSFFFSRFSGPALNFRIHWAWGNIRKPNLNLSWRCC